jgi:hypothetical protein
MTFIGGTLSVTPSCCSTRQPGNGLVHQPDRGTQPASIAFGRRCREAGIALSMGSIGDAYDCETERASRAA